MTELTQQTGNAKKALAGKRPRSPAQAISRAPGPLHHQQRRDRSRHASTCRRWRAPTTTWRSSAFPASIPFTRGVQPNMYRGRFWTMRQYAGFGNAQESNERYKFLIAQGQTGLSVAFDLPTQIGYDADHAFAEGEVGKVGVSISSLRDMETLLDGIPLDKVSISMTINAPAAILLAMVIAVGKQQGVPAKALRGTIQNDILKEYIARGTYIFPPAPSMRLITDIFRYCAAEVPKWNTISISGYHIREAGSTAVQEVAFTLANGIEYVQAGHRRRAGCGRLCRPAQLLLQRPQQLPGGGRQVPRGPPPVGQDHARALRRDRTRDSWRLRFHTQTGGSTLTAQQPDNNIVRVTIQALSAVLGGTQSLHTNSKDEALALPTQKAVEIALRTQQIIAYESGVADTVDPAGRLLLRRVADRRDRAPGRSLPGQDRRAGRRACGGGRRLYPARDSGCRLPHPARDREGRPGRGRRQSLPDRRAHARANCCASTRACAPTRSQPWPTLRADARQRRASRRSWARSRPLPANRRPRSCR